MQPDDILNLPFSKIILSNKIDKSFAYNKAVIVPIQWRNKQIWQMTLYTDKQAFQENLKTLSELKKRIQELFQIKYKQLNFFGTTEDIELKLSKKGKILVGRHKHATNAIQTQKHNRTKNRLLAEGEKILPLIDMGVMNKDGKIIAGQMDKFRQINKFLEMVDDTLKNWEKPTLTVIDFGCGKSYLTFVLYYYLTQIKKLNARVIGLDLKEEVIEKCNIVAEKYGYKNLSFQIGNINAFQPDEKIDMVVSLHACDTATDYALFNAVSWDVPIILSVPCCQHEINTQIKNAWPIMTKYGLIKERFSALLTDAIRANLLESEGYHVQVMEFIPMEHTAKNVLIRAVKQNKKASTDQVQDLCQQFNIQPTLLKLLEEKKHKRITS
jgi:2-polyprenyl-3-methyl-5-hydroxy-6-metoxy-1,4-benzoquinol methylase